MASLIRGGFGGNQNQQFNFGTGGLTSIGPTGGDFILGPDGKLIRKPQPTGPTTPAEAYKQAIPRAFSDYDELTGLFKSALGKAPEGYSQLMSNYQRLLGQQGQRITPYKAQTYRPQTYSPTTREYERGGELGPALGILKELAQTGGYSEADIANLRARGISPIRSVYANAMRNLERSRNLQGGYSPNLPAASARMAREASDLTSGATTDVNARLAEMIASGKMAMAPQYASAAGRESEIINQINQANAAARREAAQFGATAGTRAAEFGATEASRAEQFNRQAQLQQIGQDLQRQFGAMGGMAQLFGAEQGRQTGLLGGLSSLYGTTPGLAQLFGQQTLSAADLDRLNKSMEQQGQLGLIGRIGVGF